MLATFGELRGICSPTVGDFCSFFADFVFCDFRHFLSRIFATVETTRAQDAHEMGGKTGRDGPGRRHAVPPIKLRFRSLPDLCQISARSLTFIQHARTSAADSIEFPLAGGHRRPSFWSWAFGCRRLCLVMFLASSRHGSRRFGGLFGAQIDPTDISKASGEPFGELWGPFFTTCCEPLPFLFFDFLWGGPFRSVSANLLGAGIGEFKSNLQKISPVRRKARAAGEDLGGV